MASSTTVFSSYKRVGLQIDLLLKYLARPAPQSSLSHSRLVTTKLTATPLSTSPGPGWSRPTSATPPAPSPASAPTPAGNKPTAPAVGLGLPQLSPVGKVIQPQARNALKQKVDNLSAPGKPAWRSVQPGNLASGLGSSNEFPTAAEAAQGMWRNLLMCAGINYLLRASS